MKNILITGCAGFIGYSLIDELAFLGVNIYTGHIRFPIISYGYNLKNRDENLYEIKFK